MKERPILFSAPMVRALLAGQKTQTRRAFSKRMIDTMYNAAHMGEVSYFIDGGEMEENDLSYVADWCPYGKIGDRMWVRETWRGVVEISPPDAIKPEYGVARYIPAQEHCKRIEYAATQECGDDPWRPSIHMPRWACRILLEIVSVRVEKLNDCSVSDALAEGVFTWWREIEQTASDHPAPPAIYRELWESINGAGSWAANPWVWVVEFRRI
ncbi:hypothetical protein [Herbaspirillum sp. YR522]|uniref:hypothetical protein n=1 Tax=Herbaspirillum sp. YR522 TaxID=1144342 RepID=UPI00026FA287|nr:hypothetical protein [Herbaspirillum sp. YR522]EJN06441.1 hypothetical protein PMI40_02227 [Herbaspirillum sp. YR522]